MSVFQWHYTSTYITPGTHKPQLHMLVLHCIRINNQIAFSADNVRNLSAKQAISKDALLVWSIPGELINWTVKWYHLQTLASHNPTGFFSQGWCTNTRYSHMHALKQARTGETAESWLQHKSYFHEKQQPLHILSIMMTANQQNLNMHPLLRRSTPMSTWLLLHKGFCSSVRSFCHLIQDSNCLWLPGASSSHRKHLVVIITTGPCPFYTGGHRYSSSNFPFLIRGGPNSQLG